MGSLSGVRNIKRSSLLAMAVATAAAGFMGNSLKAATIQWADVGTDWNTAANWNPATAIPGNNDVALFGSASYVNQPTLSAAVSVGGVEVSGAGAMTISGSTLTLRGSGVVLDSGAGNLTISAGIALRNNTVIPIINNSASTLALNGTGDWLASIQTGQFVNLQNNGAGSITSTTILNKNGYVWSGDIAYGIVAPWATWGSGTNTKYLHITGGVFDGYTASGGDLVTDINKVTAADHNYDLDLTPAGTPVTVLAGASATSDTIRFMGTVAAAQTITLGDGSVSALNLQTNGLLNATGQTVTIANAANNTGVVLVGGNAFINGTYQRFTANAASGDIDIVAPINNVGTAQSIITTTGDGVHHVMFNAIQNSSTYFAPYGSAQRAWSSRIRLSSDRART